MNNLVITNRRASAVYAALSIGGVLIVGIGFSLTFGFAPSFVIGGPKVATEEIRTAEIRALVQETERTREAGLEKSGEWLFDAFQSIKQEVVELFSNFQEGETEWKQSASRELDSIATQVVGLDAKVGLNALALDSLSKQVATRTQLVEVLKSVQNSLSIVNMTIEKEKEAKREPARNHLPLRATDKISVPQEIVPCNPNPGTRMNWQTVPYQPIF